MRGQAHNYTSHVMHRFDAIFVPVAYAVGLFCLFIGNTLQVSGACCPLRSSGLFRVGIVWKLAGSICSTTASGAHVLADKYAQREGSPRDEVDPVNRALDFPAAYLQFATSCILLSTNTCAIIAAFGGSAASGVAIAARFLFLVAASIGLLSTTLHVVSEINRTLNIAILVRQLRQDLRQANANTAFDIDSPTRNAAAARAVASFDFRHGHDVFLARNAAAFCPADFVAAISPFVMASVVTNVCASATLLAGAILNIVWQRLASLIILEVAFILFITGVILVLFVGATKVSAHRRGGRSHLLYDVNKTLRRVV